MGFKKTSEGRVYFKSPDNDDAPSEPVKAPKEPVITKNNTQMQILLLLKSLNTKLKDSKQDQVTIKKELEGYKATIKSLEGKIAKAPKPANAPDLAEYKAKIKSLEEKTNKQQSDYIDLEQKVAKKQNETSKKTTRVEETVKTTLKQLEEAKNLVKELEEKAESQTDALKDIKSEAKKRAEEQAKAAKELAEKHKGLEDQTKGLEDKHKTLEKAQKDQNEKMVNNVAAYVALTKRMGEAETRADTLENKIEDASSEYLKLDRKIDKVIEDRNRILRKVERIEQAVLETRDALNAKAMVLLTDQGVGGIDMPQITDQTLQTDPLALQKRMQEEAMMPWWRKPVRIQATSLALLMLVILLIGWIMSAANRPEVISQRPQPTAMAPPTVVLDPPKYEETAANEETAPIMEDEILEQIDFAEQTQTAAVEEQAPEPDFQKRPPEIVEKTDAPPAEPAATETETASAHGITIHKGVEDPAAIKKDKPLDINNDAEMLAAMNENPQKVAERLNQIEPGEVEVAAATQSKPVVSTPRAQSESAVSQRVIDSVYKSALKRRIKEDPNLTDMAKKIETKAFDGIPEAQHDMGAIYVGGHGNIERNLPRAVLWFQEAANNGVANAKYNLGVLYHQGLGVEANLNTALDLYREAASQGHPEAQYNLGIANIEGIGVSYNPQKAANYFRQAANQNVKEAAYNLGLIYENGLLGTAKPDVALAWYKFAADQGSAEAGSAMNQLAASLGINTQDINRIAAKVHNTDAGPIVNQSSTLDTKTLISQTQAELMRRGLYPGPVDGVMGPMTRNAIESFQKSANLNVTGEASIDLLKYLGASSRPQ